MIYYVYVIYNLEHHRFWYGICTDLKGMEHAHNNGLVAETQKTRPWTLVYHEEFASKHQAVRRLNFFQSRSGQNYLKNTLHY